MSKFSECPDGLQCVIKGPYQYKELSEVPSNYLRWLAEDCFIEWLRDAADKVWQWREAYNEHWYEEY